MLIRYIILTPIGQMEITGSELGVQSVRRLEQSAAGTAVLQEEAVLSENHPVAMCALQVTEYFAGARETFDVKLDWGGTPEFHRLVWTELLKIPFGRTTTYSAIAESLGNPAAVRAVGLANRSNPIAIIVPCHRVIGKSGELRGYFYGLDTKMLLLRHDNPQKFSEQGALF